MANPLQAGMPPPDPPEIDQGTNQLQQNAPPGPVQQAQPQQQQAPAPTHSQTVAAMRHFSEINREFLPLLKNPDLGKSDMKSSIIDAVTKLVASRVIPPSAAVAQLATVPEKPKDQRAWAMNLYHQNEMAAAVMLEHHRKAFAGQPENESDQYNPDNHIDHMHGVMSHFRGK